jgi:arsenite methyltransferase
MPAFLRYAQEQEDVASIRDEMSKSPISLVVAVASFVPRCKSLLAGIEKLECEYDGGTCCGPPVDAAKPNVIVIKTDESDDLEELAIELGLNDVPSFQIYRDGVVLAASEKAADVTVDNIRDQLKSAAAAKTAAGACCPTPNASSSCCPDESAPTDASDILKLVQQSYAQTVKGEEGCCVSVQPEMLGYTQEQIIKAGKDANLGLGCGNPINFANIQKGETVVDLGSGAGIDCFLAADLVGESGTVIGIDMTPDMIYKARQNASKRAVSKNVQFRLGEIEHLPVADNTVDVVISNCVINLSPDKPQVFREIYRILKKGGRIGISDVVIRPNKAIPQRLKSAEALAC